MERIVNKRSILADANDEEDNDDDNDQGRGHEMCPRGFEVWTPPLIVQEGQP